MVGLRFLVPAIGVRVPDRQPTRDRLLRTRRVNNHLEIYSENAYLLRAVTRLKNRP